MNAKQSIWALVDSFARVALNLPRQVGSDDCDQNKIEPTEPEWLDWDEYRMSKELGDPGA